MRLDLLRESIDNSGITMVALAKKTGILRETLYNRFAGVGEFTVSEADALSKALHLTKKEREDIFFS